MAARIAVVLLVAAVLALRLGPRSRGHWGLDAAVALGWSLAACGVADVQTDVGQVLLGIGLLMVAVFAAYFLPRRRFLAHLGLVLGRFVVAAATHPLAASPITYPLVAVAVAGTSITVSRLVGGLRDLVLRDGKTGLLNRRDLAELSPSPPRPQPARARS